MMDYRENAGYLITDSCHVGDSEFVLGVHLTEPHQFVTWKCTNQTDYYWGHYFSDLFSAQKDRLKAPAYSPWGEIQICDTLCPGAYLIRTKRNGGVMVHRDLADKVFRKEAKECGYVKGAYLCFGETYDEPVALRELMDKKLYQAPVNQFFGPGEYEKVIDHSLQSDHPEYWEAREKAMAEESRQPKKKDRGEAR